VAKTGAQPERRCIVSGTVRPARELIRFVVGPDGAIVPDVTAKLPGRGIWVSADRDALRTAVEKKLFARAAKAQVTASGDLPERVDGLLSRNCLNLLGLARRAGEAVSGFDQVMEALDTERPAAVLTASDAAPNGRAKVAAKIKAMGGTIPNVDLFDVGELSLALGRENVVHAALRPGGLARRFLAECGRLAAFRATSEATGRLARDEVFEQDRTVT
jgi:predicted RNA-binding protein YlxR (DUF448 family)